jgi:exodeoxyribonuclease V gamma subunit
VKPRVTRGAAGYPVPSVVLTRKREDYINAVTEQTTMSVLYLGTDLESLAGELALVLDAAVKDDCFRAVTIVVPNRNVRKWLQLYLSRRDGVAINLHFDYLEQVLWKLLSDLDPRQHDAPLFQLEDEHYRLLTLVPLLENDGSPIDPLSKYLGDDKKNPRNWWRRAWSLADHLAGLIRDYEYHRQDAIIRKWLDGQDAFPEADSQDLAMERAQRELFRRITRIDRPEEGLRGRLGGLLHLPKVCKTLPQYAAELRHEVNSADLRLPTEPLVVPLFGVTQLSAFHVDALHWLGRYLDIRLFHQNPLVGRLAGSSTRDDVPSPAPSAAKGLSPLPRTRGRGQGEGVKHALRQDQPFLPNLFPSPPPLSPFSGERGDLAASARDALEALARRFRRLDVGEQRQPASEAGEDLLAVWGSGGAESLGLAASLLAEPSPFQVELVAPRPPVTTVAVLPQLQSQLLGSTGPKADPTPQDVSLQIVACQGIYREVETVHASIAANLNQNSALKQTDIAVLVTDVPRYRPVIQAVFDREPRPLMYNLSDFSAAELSTFGYAVHRMLDLALESFTRSHVFDVLLNPCFLARLGVERSQASVWLGWAEELGVYHGWDAEDRHERGYGKSPLFGWQLALRRLRLGRIMIPGNARGDGPAPCFKEVIPYADLQSGDREQLDAFCRAVEALLPRLRRLRTGERTGKAWAGEIRRLVDDFLVVPDELKAETQVRDRLVRRLDDLAILDGLRSTPGPLPLALVRELVTACLQKTVGTLGQPLTNGVTIGSLEMLRALPFRVVYILGLGEGLFPGSDSRSTLDLRHRRTLPGDIRPPETNRFLFLEALLAARDKVYLLYDCRELQRDQELHPSSVINQIGRYLEEHILAEKPLQIVAAPLRSSDAKYLAEHPRGAANDVLSNFSRVDRSVALAECRARGELILTKTQGRQLDAELAKHQKDFTPAAAAPVEQTDHVPTVTIRELVHFLRCPAEAALRRHLRLKDEEEPERADDEPFYVSGLPIYRLLGNAQERFLHRAIREGLETALGDWKDDFTALHDEWRRRCLAPEGAFGDADCMRFLADLEPRIEGLAGFLRQQAHREFIGPVQIGAPSTPVGARTLLPDLVLETARGPARVIGTHAYMWIDSEALVLLAIHVGAADKVKPDLLCRPLLAPMLFGLALRAGETLANAGEFVRRFAGRDLFVHVAHQEGVARYSWSPDEVPPEKARDYLTGLVAEFLDPTGFDLLPLEILMGCEDLHQAFRGADVAPSEESKRAFVKRLREATEEDGDNGYRRLYNPMKLLQMVAAEVPPDAFDKVRRRFRLLDCGTACARREASA